MRRHEIARMADVSMSLFAPATEAMVMAGWLLRFPGGFAFCWQGYGRSRSHYEAFLASAGGLLEGGPERKPPLSVNPRVETVRNDAALPRCGALIPCGRPSARRRSSSISASGVCAPCDRS